MRTSARATGWPLASVTLPVIAPVVTPWARTAGARSVENTTAAATARGALTIHGMVGCLLYDTRMDERPGHPRNDRVTRWEVLSAFRGGVLPAARAVRLSPLGYVLAFLHSHTPAAPNSRFGTHAANAGGSAPPAPTAFNS